MRILVEIIKFMPCYLVGRLESMTRVLQFHAMLGRDFWYVTDHWEVFHSIPVTVIDNSGGYLTLIWELGDGLFHKFRTKDPNELYRKRADANQAASRRNNLIKMRCGKWAEKQY